MMMSLMTLREAGKGADLALVGQKVNWTFPNRNFSSLGKILFPEKLSKDRLILECPDG
jgi:hypothetical protein